MYINKYRELINKRNELNKQGLKDENLNNEIINAYILAFNQIEDTIESEKREVIK